MLVKFSCRLCWQYKIIRPWNLPDSHHIIPVLKLNPYNQKGTLMRSQSRFCLMFFFLFLLSEGDTVYAEIVSWNTLNITFSAMWNLQSYNDRWMFWRFLWFVKFSIYWKPGIFLLRFARRKSLQTTINLIDYHIRLTTDADTSKHNQRTCLLVFKFRLCTCLSD